MGEVIAFIPARGGSSRVPRKNLQTVGGLTLLERAVRCAQVALGDEAKVVVSTEDHEIADRAVALGARVHLRRPEHATAEAQIENAMLAWAEDGRVRDDAVLVLLQPTTPFRRPQTVGAVVAQVLATGEPCMTARRSSAVHFSGMEVEGGEHVAWPRDPDANNRPRSQDLDFWLVEDGNVYALAVGTLRRSRNRLGDTLATTPDGGEALVTRFVESGRFEAFEIDTMEDLATARLLAPLIDQGRLS